MLVKKPFVASTERLKTGWDRNLGKCFVWLCRNRKKVLVSYIIVTIISFVGASKIEFDYYLMQDLGDDQPLMQELFFFQDHYGGIRPFELALLPKGDYLISDFEVLKEVEKIEKYLNEEYGVNQMISPTEPYKYMNKSLRNGKDEALSSSYIVA